MNISTDLMKSLDNRLKDELSDVSTYKNIYDKLISEGQHHAAELIEEIAHDEFTHAHALKKILETHGYDVHTDDM